jgi:hypothetical protein
MLDGQVDAIVATPAGSWQMVETEGTLDFRFRQRNETGHCRFWVASEEMITKRPELLRKRSVPSTRVSAHPGQSRLGAEVPQGFYRGEGR